MKGLLIDPSTEDLQITGGTIAIGDNTAQVAEAVLQASPGEFKEFPLLGAGIIQLHHGHADPMWGSHAKEMLLAAGVPVKRVLLEGNKITVE